MEISYLLSETSVLRIGTFAFFMAFNENVNFELLGLETQTGVCPGKRTFLIGDLG